MRSLSVKLNQWNFTSEALHWSFTCEASLQSFTNEASPVKLCSKASPVKFHCEASSVKPHRWNFVVKLLCGTSPVKFAVKLHHEALQWSYTDEASHVKPCSTYVKLQLWSFAVKLHLWSFAVKLHLWSFTYDTLPGKLLMCNHLYIIYIKKVRPKAA